MQETTYTLESSPITDPRLARQAWIRDGVLVARDEANPFDPGAITQLRELARADFAERSADVEWHSAPRHNSLVFLRDETGAVPELQTGRSKEILEICNRPEILEQVRVLTGFPDLNWRLIRFHRMVEGGQFSPHRDTEENPDYQVSLVLGLNDPLSEAFSGGETVSMASTSYYDPLGAALCRRRLVLGDAFIMDSSQPHLVEPVQGGFKDSFILFGATSGQANTRVSFRAATAYHERWASEVDGR